MNIRANPTFKPANLARLEQLIVPRIIAAAFLFLHAETPADCREFLAFAL